MSYIRDLTVLFLSLLSDLSAYAPEIWINHDLIRKFHNVLVPHPAMYPFVAEMCTYVHISVTKWFIVGHLPGGVCELNLFMEIHQVVQWPGCADGVYLGSKSTIRYQLVDVFVFSAMTYLPWENIPSTEQNELHISCTNICGDICG